MIRKILLAGAASAAIAMPSMAQEIEVSGNVALSTDYVWRGATQTGGDGAISGGFDLAAGNFYAGTWASSVDFGTSDPDIELDVYAGFGGGFGESAAWWDLGFIAYFYPGADDLDFVELYGGVGTEFENGLGLSGYIYWDPDNEDFYVEAAAAYSFTDSVSVDAGIASYDYADNTTEIFNAGIGYSAPIGVDLDLRYWDAEGGDSHLVFTVSKAL